MIKKDRHNVILNLINEKEISTQEELTEELVNLGFEVSQSTVSRDINELNLIKAENANKKSVYVKAIDTGLKLSQHKLTMFKQSSLSIESANNLIVVKTLSGHANAVALVVDELTLPQVLGSVAGDDVVLIVAKTNQDAEIIVKSLRSI